ncbi:MAG: TonB-dependent receptor, partial [Pseudomonadota bacterium]
MRRGLLRSASGFALSVVGALGAAAQDGSDEIVVEGTRFQSSLSNRLDVPKEELVSTIDELDQDALQTFNFINFQESLTTLPSVTFADFNAATGEIDLFLRGIADPSFLINNRLIPDVTPSGVGFGASNPDQSFIETYEVLKGPASIIFGPVTPGGVINQVYRSPKSEDFVNLAVTGDTFGSYRVETDLNSGALFGQDWLRGRMTVAYEDVKFAQPEAERQVLAIRPVIEADITDKTALQLSFAYKESEGINTSRFPIFEGGIIPEQFSPDTFIGDPTSGTVSENIYTDGEFVHNFLDNLKLTLRGAYGDIRTDADYASGFYSYDYDGDGVYGITIDMDSPFYGIGYAGAYRNAGRGEVFYGDAQLAGFFDLFGNRQDALIGVTRQSLKVETFFGGGLAGQLIDVNDPSTFIIGPIDFNAVDIFDPANPDFETVFIKNVLTSVYGEVYLRPTEWLTIPVGVRYDSVEQTGDPTGANSETFDDVTVRTGLNAEVIDGINLYYSYAQSFIPNTGVDRDGNTLIPETANNHEIGVKATIIDGMYLTAAAYRLERNNLETLEGGQLPPGEVRFSVAEGQQTIKGFEINLAGQLTDQLSLNFSYGYVDAEITEPINFRVGRVDQISDHTLSLYSTYRFDEGALSGFRVGGGIRFISDRLARADSVEGSIDDDTGVVTLAEATFEAPGYTIFDLIFGYELNDRWDLQLNVQNVTNEEYFVQVGYGSTFGGGWKFGQPANALFTLR